MIICPEKQTNLYGLNNYLDEFIRLYNDNKLPNKILLSGFKGIGKSTLAYHLINYILSKDEEYSYDLKNNCINPENRSFKLIQNGSNQNFIRIDVNSDKKKIEISQIREMIEKLNKSSLNSKPRFVLIDNIQHLNHNSINALLKILEEPNYNVNFILIYNNKRILKTLLSRCLNFKITLTNEESKIIFKKIIGNSIEEIINKELIDYYFTPGKILNLIRFAEENSIDIKNLNLKQFLIYIISKGHYKKESSIKDFIFDYFELFLVNNKTRYFNHYNHFVKRYDNVKKFNLDEDTFFLEYKQKILYV